MRYMQLEIQPSSNWTKAHEAIVQFLYAQGYDVAGNPQTGSIELMADGVKAVLLVLTQGPQMTDTRGKITDIRTLISGMLLDNNIGQAGVLGTQLFLSPGARDLLINGIGPGGDVDIYVLQTEISPEDV